MTTQYPYPALTSHQQDLLQFQQLEDYPWDSDMEFQSGLHAILASHPAAEQAEYLTLRARCFYFARKNNTSIDFNAYQTWLAQKPSSSAKSKSVKTSTSNDPPRLVSASHSKIDTSLEGFETAAPYPISFSQIVQLITSGAPIPGIKEVPDTVLEGQASLPTRVKRRKPWEKDVSATEDYAERTNQS